MSENNTVKLNIYILLAKKEVAELNSNTLYETWVEDVFADEKDANDSKEGYSRRSWDIEYEVDRHLLEVPMKLFKPLVVCKHYAKEEFKYALNDKAPPMFKCVDCGEIMEE